MRMLRGVPRRELFVLGALMAAGLALRLAYVLSTTDVPPNGDEPAYHEMGRLAAEEGRWLWGDVPYGIDHATVWKMPLYPLWMGVWYSILGADPEHVRAVQTLIGPVVIALTWLLGRRLFSPRVGLAAAAVVAVYPFAWQYEARLYSESLATPLTLALLLVVLRPEPPTVRRALGAGALLALSFYVRPSAFVLAAALVVAFWVTAGFWRGTRLAVISAAVVAVALVPWWLRTLDVEGAFVPLSTQDAALYGTFNDEAAHDERFPWAWRALNKRDAPLLDRRNPMPEHELRRRLRENATEYIRDHPSSVPKAFFWNGIVRTWDLRRPSNVYVEVPFEGRSLTLTKIGLIMYWVLLPLAVVGLWLQRRRRYLVLPVLAIALASSVIFTANGGTRYRAPLEPVIAVLACGSVFALIDRRRRPAAQGPASTAATTSS